MIADREALIQFLLEVEPAYRLEYKKNIKKRKRPPSISGDVTDFSHFVEDRLKEGQYQNADKVFQAVESLLVESASTDAIKDAICTCFLENLLNFFTEYPAILATFVPLLGEKSKAYCKAWDEFSGVRTPGLYDQD